MQHVRSFSCPALGLAREVPSLSVTGNDARMLDAACREFFANSCRLDAELEQLLRKLLRIHGPARSQGACVEQLNEAHVERRRFAEGSVMPGAWIDDEDISVGGEDGTATTTARIEIWQQPGTTEEVLRGVLSTMDPIMEKMRRILAAPDTIQ